MSTYRKAILRLCVLGVLVMSLILFTGAPVQADSCTAECNAQHILCVEECHGNQSCTADCLLNYEQCLLNCD